MNQAHARCSWQPGSVGTGSACLGNTVRLATGKNRLPEKSSVTYPDHDSCKRGPDHGAAAKKWSEAPTPLCVLDAFGRLFQFLMRTFESS